MCDVGGVGVGGCWGGGVFYKQPVSNHLPAELRPVHRISHYSEIFALILEYFAQLKMRIKDLFSKKVLRDVKNTYKCKSYS